MRQIADVTIFTPQSWSPQQVNNMAGMLTANPASVFNAAFLAAYPEISGFKVTTASALPPVTKRGLSNAAKIGIGAGVGGGGGLLLGGVAVYIIIRRRRRMGVEPRTSLGIADDDLPA